MVKNLDIVPHELVLVDIDKEYQSSKTSLLFATKIFAFSLCLDEISSFVKERSKYILRNDSWSFFKLRAKSTNKKRKLPSQLEVIGNHFLNY